MPRRVYDHKGWRDIRKFVLERDNDECRIRLPGCLGIADCVDHIVPADSGGAWFDPLNLRAACTHCNSARVHRGGDPAEPRPLPRHDW
jgi:5-methylcytosine-specific restriction endonuclease McrA